MKHIGIAVAVMGMVAMVLTSRPALATQRRASLQVSVYVLSRCDISSATLDADRAGTLANSPSSAAGALGVRCSRGITYRTSIEMAPSSTSSTPVLATAADGSALATVEF